MFNSIFIYCPRSGSRLFAENLYGHSYAYAYPRPVNLGGGRISTFALIEWGNKSVHLLSGTTEEQGSSASSSSLSSSLVPASLNTVLTYSTARANYHWRTAARAVATHLINAYGGFAWDENGTVRLLLPRGRAGAAHRLMLAARSREVSSSMVFGDEDAANEVALLLDGSGYLAPQGQAQPIYKNANPHFHDPHFYGYGQGRPDCADYVVSAAVELIANSDDNGSEDNGSEDHGSEDNRKWVVTVRRTQVRRADNVEMGSEVLGTVTAPEAFGRPTLRGLNEAGRWVAD